MGKIRDLKWKYIKPLEDKKRINYIEKKCNFSIPEQLKEYIINYNGGIPSINVFDSLNTKENLFGALISYNKSDSFNIDIVLEIFYNNYRNRDLLPFADDGCGNFICINIKTLEIVYFLHETEEIEFLSDNFNSFIECLYTI